MTEPGEVIKATGGCTFVQKTGKNGRLLESSCFRFDEDHEAIRLAKYLNNLESKTK